MKQRKVVKIQGKVRYMELKAGAKAGVLLGRGYAKAIRKMRGAKRDMAIRAAASGATPVLRNAADYDVSRLENKNNIKSPQRDFVSAKGQTEDLEAKNKAKSKAEQQKEKLAPKERKSLHGKEKADHIAEKNRVRSRNRKDNLKKKRKEKQQKKKGAAVNAAKRELKYLAARQVLMEGEPSGAEASIGIGKSVLVDWVQRLGKGSAKLVGKLMLKLFGGLATLLLHLLLMLVLSVLPLLLPVLAVLAAIAMLAGIAAMVAGIFISTADAEQGDFAVKLIHDRKAAIMQEAKGYGEARHDGKEVEEVIIRYSGIAGMDANSDDMLLAYMSKAAGGISLTGTKSAPLLRVDTYAEMQAMDEVLSGMIYIKSVEYEERTRQATVTATPTPTPPGTPSPPPPGTPGQTPQGTPTPTMPPEEPETITVTETYYVAEVVIEGICADAWLDANVTDRTAYAFLRDMFLSFGYVPGGGSAVCRKYEEAALD